MHGLLANGLETFEGDEDLVRAGVGEAQIAEGYARGEYGDGTGFLCISLGWGENF
jgi:hypothetical protein